MSPTGARRRRQGNSGPGPGPRLLLTGMLVVATLAGAWWFLIRDDGAKSTRFIRAERDYVSAARAVPAAADKIQRQSDLELFDLSTDDRSAEMKAAADVIARVSRQEAGAAAKIAVATSETAIRGLTEVERFRHAMVGSKNPTDAAAARTDLEATIAAMEQHARDWNRLD